MSGLTAASLGGLGAGTFSMKEHGPCYRVFSWFDNAEDIYIAAPKGSTAEANAKKALDRANANLVKCRASKGHQDWLRSQAVDPGAPPQIYTSSIDRDPPEYDSSIPATDLPLTQYAVQQVNLQNQQASLSPQAQAAAIRNRWRSTRQPAPARPLPSRAPRPDPDLQELLALRARQGTGAKIAAYGLAAVAVISLAALLIPTRRRAQ